METDKNGGPNNLKAWREHRSMSQEELAAAVEPPTSPTMISMLESGDRGLSAKWLRRLGDALKVSPGHLLDHNPRDLSADILDIWSNADPATRRQIAEVAKAIVKTGTNG
jgi:transcriptional regulator with XRE-family HTH domain